MSDRGIMFFMNILCISIDGLHNGMIGAFGNAWIQTSALDTLACQAVLFDRYYTDSMRLDTVFNAFWRHLADLTDHQTVLLTDDDDVFHHALADFSERHRLELSKLDRPVAEVDQTQCFQAFATIIDLFENRLKSRDKPVFLWTHLQGFRGVWDCPMDYRRQYQGDEDPEPYAGVVPPEILVEPGKMIDPDDLQAVMETYAGGISAMDHALTGLLDWFKESPLAVDTLLVFLSSRGFSLGEHDRIGPNEMLYGENVQLPLFIRFPDGFEAAGRCNAIMTPGDLGDFLSAATTGNKMFEDFKKLFQDATEPRRQSLFLGETGHDRALLTDEWFLRKTDDRFELYVKPDDRWEVNDVADRCPETAEELLTLLESRFDRRLSEP